MASETICISAQLTQSALQALVGIAVRSGEHAARDISYVAVHGTGTPLGDPIEVGALSAALAAHDPPVYHGVAFGSVKVSHVKQLSAIYIWSWTEA